MMNVAYQGPWPQLSDADALLMDVARRIQLTRTKHEAAERNFRALCQHVDRDGSPLHNLVVECYPSGSFATGTATASRVSKNQHDVDVVIELKVPPSTPPQDILEMLFEAINGDEGSRYHGKVRLNSRCVTVTYEDGTKVDLMPIARFAGGPDRAGNLFHFKRESGEAYHKPVNPWGFADYFNRHVEYSPAFHELFKGRRLLVEGGSMIAADAQAQPLPDHEPIEEKSPRVVAIQLIKRARDIAFRQREREKMRKPPSVVIAAIALEAGPVNASLVDELISVATAIRTRLLQRNGSRGNVQVYNPAYPAEEFTDRWPENVEAQDLFDGDLRRLVVELHRLKNDELSLSDKRELLSRLFGETAASYAMDSYLDAQRHEMEAGRLHTGPKGKIVSAAVAAPAVVGARTTAARPATREGGGYLPE
jgi:Second Messenger Oligonucleotide or Dinucleotide Synthetase domain